MERSLRHTDFILQFRHAKNRSIATVFVVAEEGFEPSQTESESVVLPLHNSAILSLNDDYYTTTENVCQVFSSENFDNLTEPAGKAVKTLPA